MRFEKHLELTKEEAEELRRYVDEEDLELWVYKQYDYYANDKKIRWSRTPSVWADDILKEIFEALDNNKNLIVVFEEE